MNLRIFKKLDGDVKLQALNVKDEWADFDIPIVHEKRGREQFTFKNPFPYPMKFNKEITTCLGPGSEAKYAKLHPGEFITDPEKVRKVFKEFSAYGFKIDVPHDAILDAFLKALREG